MIVYLHENAIWQISKFSQSPFCPASRNFPTESLAEVAAPKARQSGGHRAGWSKAAASRRDRCQESEHRRRLAAAAAPTPTWLRPARRSRACPLAAVSPQLRQSVDAQAAAASAGSRAPTLVQCLAAYDVDKMRTSSWTSSEASPYAPNTRPHRRPKPASLSATGPGTPRRAPQCVSSRRWALSRYSRGTARALAATAKPLQRSPVP